MMIPKNRVSSGMCLSPGLTEHVIRDGILGTQRCHEHLIVPAGAIDEQALFRAKWFDAMRLAGLHAKGRQPGEWVVGLQGCGTW
jgi:hypothetical protein